MTDPQPNPSDRSQRLDAFVSENGMRLNLELDDGRIESLRCYQHWALKDLDTLSGITDFCDIMCAVEWLQKTLTADASPANSLYRYGLETLTVRELLLHLGLSTTMLDVEAVALRTVPEYVQTAYNSFHLQSEYQDDLTATGKLMEQLRDYASANDITLIQPDDLREAAMDLHTVLLARGYPTVELALTLRSETTVGGVPLDSLSELMSLRVKQTAAGLRVALWPETGHSTVLEVPGDVLSNIVPGDTPNRECYIGGLDAAQMQALAAALRDRTQHILSHSPTSDETATLRTVVSRAWHPYLLPFQVYASRSAAVRQLHLKELHSLAAMLRAALWQQFEDSYQQHADTPLTLATECQQVIHAYLKEQLEHAVYSHGRLAYLAQDVATVIIGALAESEYSWTDEQNEAAKVDGWHVVDVGSNTPERDRYRLQACDRSRFETDEQAWLHVVQQSRLDSRNLYSQALAFLQSQASREHRLVWVSAYTHLVKEALQSPEPIRAWLQTLAPKEVIGWQPVEVFLQSLGVQRSSVSADHVWLYYWDEEAPLPVLGMTVQGQPLPESPLPTWVSDFDAEMAEVALNTDVAPTAMDLFHYVDRVIPD